jgi:hypothetical protein
VQVEQRIRSRFTGPVELNELIGDEANPMSRRKRRYGYMLDGSTKRVASAVFDIGNPQSEERARNQAKTAMEQATMALIDSIIGPMKSTVAKWPV